MPTARGDLASATVKGKIYAIGGHTGITWDDPGTIYATVEEFCVTSRRRTAVDHSEIGPSLLETERHRLCRGKRFICRGTMDEAGEVRESNGR